MEFSTAVMYIALFSALYLEVFLLITFLENALGPQKKRPRMRRIPDNLPSVAIVVPCFNQSETLAATLRSLLALDYPKEKLEIIAVDDGSTDDTYEIMRKFEADPRVRIFRKENGGKHSAMNLALENTGAKIIGCLDADSFVAKDALLHLMPHFDDPRVAAVTPSIKVFEPRGVLQLVQKAEYGLSIFIRKTFSLLDAIFITPGPFSFFRKSAIHAVGPWRHGHSTEDLEMGIRLQKSHFKIQNEPNAHVYTTAPATWRGLFRQRVRWTYGFLRNSADYRSMFFNPEYGNLGLLVLPFSLFSLISAVYMFALVIWNVGVFAAEQMAKFQTIGLAAAEPRFDPFYINATTVLGVTIALITLTLVLIVIGKRLASDRATPSADMALYLLLYGFLAPVWLSAATWKALTDGNVRWR
ncbi:MAG: glycosyltransferase [bacterium]|nr:glycosyltransferase [bacterium]